MLSPRLPVERWNARERAGSRERSGHPGRSGTFDLTLEANGLKEHARSEVDRSLESSDDVKEILRLFHRQVLDNLDSRLSDFSERILEEVGARQHMPFPRFPGKEPSAASAGERAHPGWVRQQTVGVSNKPKVNLRMSYLNSEEDSEKNQDHMRHSPIELPLHGEFRENGGRSSEIVPDSESQMTLRKRLHKLVSDNRFEAFFGIVVFTNAIFIGYQVDTAVRQDREEGWARVVNQIYTCIFTAELALRMMDARWSFFWQTNMWYWNLLDTVIVVISWVEFMLQTFFLDDGYASSRNSSQFRVLRIVRITRLIKVIRVTRIIRFIRALRMMVHQLISTVRSLLWAVALLTLIIYVFSIMFSQAYLMNLDNNPSGEGLPEMLVQYWSTIPRSMLTLFQAVTGGVSWDDVSRPLSSMGSIPVLMFVVYICFAQLAVLNVITGVFCQSAIDSAAHDQELVAQAMLENRQLYADKLKQIFADFDESGSGLITMQEFRAHLKDENVRAYLDSMEVDTSDVLTLFRLLDSDDRAILQMDEFVAGCMRLKGAAKGIDMAKLCYAQEVLSKRLESFISRMDQTFEYMFGGGGLDHTDSMNMRPVVDQDLRYWSNKSTSFCAPGECSWSVTAIPEMPGKEGDAGPSCDSTNSENMRSL